MGEPRYEIHTGKFGQYFYDSKEDSDMPLAKVLDLLNEHEEHDSPSGLVHKAAYEQIEVDLHCARDEFARVNKANHAEIVRLKTELAEMTFERNALAADIEAERAGNLKLRKEFGARKDETMAQFVERMAKLQVRCDYLVNKLQRIYVMLPPSGTLVDNIKAVVFEQLPKE
ncbi:MAG: hypothetical protein PHI12_11640 [Dehalococcoidales bacterium]|nr:hypothetical protein [Dehalococcoidales bacterium]